MKYYPILTIPIIYMCMLGSISAFAIVEEPKPDRPKKSEMTKAEIVNEIVEELDDEEILGFVPGIVKFEDKSGRRQYMFKSKDGSLTKLEDLEPDFVDNLLTRVRQAKTIQHAQRIQRQLEQIQQIQNLQRLNQLQAQQRTPSPPQAQPQTPPQMPRTYTPPQQPPRRPNER